MSNTVIQLKKSSTPSATPGDLANGEIAINYADGKLFYKDASGSIQQISSGGNTFSTVNAAGTLLISDLPSDILNIVAGDNIEITADALTDTFTITANLSNASGTGIGANAYATLVGDSANNFAGAMVNSANAYIVTVGINGNNYTNSVGIAANTWANTKLSNTSGVVFDGTLNIKTDLWIGNNITNVTSVIFNTSTNRTPTNPGELTWSQDDSTLRFDMDSPSNVIGHIGQDLFYYVKNQTGSTISKGTVVRFAGTLGASGRLLIAPAIANNSYPSKYVMGVTAASIADGDDGFVISQGKIRQIDTSMFSEGDILYVSPSTAGGFSNTMPTAPNNKITVAAVIKSDNIQGTIEVRVTLGSKLNEDELVELSSLTGGDVIVYNGTTGRFENQVQLALNAGSVNGLPTNTIIDTANAYSRVFANSVGSAGNANLSVATIAANNFAGSMANSVNAYTSATYSTITFASTSYDKANAANVLACTAFDKANSGVRTGYTTISNGSVSLTPSTNASTLTIGVGNVITIVANTTNNSLVVTQNPSGVTATTYGNASVIPIITVDAYGRVTSASNVAVSASGGGGLTVNNEITSSSSYYPIFTTNTTGSIAYANVANSSLYFVPSTGTLSATIFNSLSDVNVKYDISEFDGLEIINQINPVEFKWKKTGNKSYGVIAQELEKVLPELVETADSGLKSVSYIPMIAMLIDAVKKQDQRISKLEEQLNKYAK